MIPDKLSNAELWMYYLMLLTAQEYNFRLNDREDGEISQAEQDDFDYMLSEFRHATGIYVLTDTQKRVLETVVKEFRYHMGDLTHIIAGK